MSATTTTTMGSTTAATKLTASATKEEEETAVREPLLPKEEGEGGGGGRRERKRGPRHRLSVKFDEAKQVVKDSFVALFARRDLDENRVVAMFAVCEFIGTFFVTLICIGSLLSAGTLNYMYKYTELSAGRLLAISLGNGMGYGAVLYSIRSISKPFCASQIASSRRDQSRYMLRFPVGHLNPAITFAVCLVGDISAFLGLIYVAAQLVGSLAAAYFLYYVVPNAENTEMGVTVPGTEASESQAFGMELFASFVLVTTVLHLFVSSVEKTQQNSTTRGELIGHNIMEEFAPFAAGMVVSALTFFGASVSGASMNPFRSFGSALTADVWTSQWIYYVGPMCGALLGVFLSRLITLFSFE